MDNVSWRKSSYSAENGGQCVEVASWRKSSYSSGNGGECVEIASWRKSSRSAENGGACVEVATRQPRVVAVRDSKDPHGPVLVVTTDGWTNFMSKITEEPTR